MGSRTKIELTKTELWAVNNLVNKLLNATLPEHALWETRLLEVDDELEIYILGDLTTIERHEVDGEVKVIYFGTTFNIYDLERWGLFTKCDREVYEIQKNGKQGTNWSGCILPSVFCDMDSRNEFKKDIEYLFNLLIK